jgi:hypothetical protein
VRLRLGVSRVICESVVFARKDLILAISTLELTRQRLPRRRTRRRPRGTTTHYTKRRRIQQYRSHGSDMINLIVHRIRYRRQPSWRLHDANRHEWGLYRDLHFFLSGYLSSLLIVTFSPTIRVSIDESSTAWPVVRIPSSLPCTCSLAHRKTTRCPRSSFTNCARDPIYQRINDMLKKPAIGGLFCRRRWRLLCTIEEE